MRNYDYPKVVILVLNWNSGPVTIDCLTSLKAVTYPNFETILIDNGSQDGSPDLIRGHFPDISYIRLEQNSGFVEGNNIGIQAAKTRGAGFVLLLNNDTVVTPDFLSILMDAISANDDIGSVGPTICYFDRPNLIWSAGGEIDWAHGTSHMLNLNETDHKQFGVSPRRVDFVSGCALLVRMAVIQQVGLLDPRFFAYYEETEWCVRIQRAGYRILHVPEAKIWHKISPELREASPAVQYYMTRNRLLFLKLTHASLRSWIYTFYDNSHTLLSWVLKPRWRYKKDQRKAMIKALIDFSQHRFGSYS